MTQVTKSRELSSPERLQAFTDAVVAIALTLLILPPLMESVGELADHDGTTAEWLAEEQYALLGFVLSFILIAVFWVHHHKLFRSVKRVDPGLLWLTVAWMFTIVVMPVATSLSTQMQSDWAQPLSTLEPCSPPASCSFWPVLFAYPPPISTPWMTLMRCQEFERAASFPDFSCWRLFWPLSFRAQETGRCW